MISALTTGVALVGISIAGARILPSMFGFVVFGVAAAMYELTALMLLQRVARLDLVGHVFTIVEALQMAMLAVGAVIVSIDGVDTNRLGRGQGFGEIALLRDVARTATVRAATDATLLTLSRDAFLTALTGHVPTRERVTSIATGYADPG